MALDAHEADSLSQIEPSLDCPVTELREILHRYPELSHQEQQTAYFIERYLCRLGFQTVFRPAPNSVCALLGIPDDVIVVRADIDALPIDEVQDGRPYSSRNSGVMHACGHDAHTAMVIDLARRLRRNPPACGVLFVFQQAEEVHPSGASLVIEGIKNRFRFRCAFGIHVWPELDFGDVGVRAGPLLAGIDGVTLTIRERGPRVLHGLNAESGGADLIACLASVLQDLRPWLKGRNLTEASPAALHIGTVSGGSLPNRYAGSFTMKGTLRWLTTEANMDAWNSIRRIALETCERFTAEAIFEVEAGIRPAVVNDHRLITAVKKAAEGRARVIEPYPTQPLGVSDDFGLYSTLAPSALFFLGCRSTGKTTIQLHDPRFDIEPRTLALGVDILEGAVRELAAAH